MTADVASRGHGDRRPRRLDQFLAALLEHPSMESAARATGITRKTAQRWLADPIVSARFRHIRRQAVELAMARIEHAVSAAVTCLAEIQEHGESESARIAAARTIIETAMRSIELGDIQQRLDALERIAEGRKGQHHDRWQNDKPDDTPNPNARRVNGHG
jgi:hypothetical protein